MEARRPTEEPKITVGDRVVWLGSDTGKPEHGTVRWTGVLEALNQSEFSVGVELDNPVGFGDGKWGDIDLFKAKPQHGIVIPAMGLVREDVLQEPLYMSSSARARDPPLNVGDRVVWLEHVAPQHATVRWVGVLSEFGSDWTVGIEFDAQVGKMDGMWNKSQLFDCKKGHGMLVNAMGLIREDVFTGLVDEPSMVVLSENTNGQGDIEGEAGQEDQNNAQPTCESGGASSAVPSGSSTVVRAPTLAECEVQKWYDALEEDRRHKTRLKKDKKRKRFSFRRRPNGQHEDDGLQGAAYCEQIDGDSDYDSYVTEVFDVGKSPTATLPRKKTKRGGLFALFRWIRGKTRKRNGNDGCDVAVMRRSLSLDAADGGHARAVSVTSVSESFQYMPHGGNLRVPSDAFAGCGGDDGSLYESMPTPMASPLRSRRNLNAVVQPSDSCEVLAEEEDDENETRTREKLLDESYEAEKPKVNPVVVVTPAETAANTPVVTPIPCRSGGKKRRAPPPPSTPSVVASLSAPTTVTQQRGAKNGHHRSVSLGVECGSSCGSSAAMHSHVKGKRKAPLPPCQVAPSPREVIRELRRSNPVMPACESRPYRCGVVGRQMCKSVSSEVLHPVRDLARSFSSRSLGVVDDEREDVAPRKEPQILVVHRDSRQSTSVTSVVAKKEDAPISKESLADILKALDNLHTDLEEQTTKKQPETVDLRTLHDMVQSLVKQFCGKGDEDAPTVPSKPVAPKIPSRSPIKRKETKEMPVPARFAHGTPVSTKVSPKVAKGLPEACRGAPVWVKRRSASLGADPELVPPKIPEKEKMRKEREKHRSVQDWIQSRLESDKPPKTPAKAGGNDEEHENEEHIYEAVCYGSATPTEASQASVAELRRLYGGGSDRRIPQPGPIYENVHPYSFVAGIGQATPQLLAAPSPGPRYPLYAPVLKQGYFYPGMVGLGLRGFVYPPHLMFQPGVAQGNWEETEEEGCEYENGGFVGGAGRKSFVASQVKRIEAANRWSSNIATTSGVVVHSQNVDSNQKLDCDEYQGDGDDDDEDDDDDDDHGQGDREGKRPIRQASRRKEVNSRPVPAPRSSIQPRSNAGAHTVPLAPQLSRPLPRARGAEGESSVMIGGYRVATPLDLWPLEYEAIAPELCRLQAKLSGKARPEELSDAAPVSDTDSLSINRLLRKLEAAICRGRRKEAAVLARELARLKINCTMKRLRLAKDANPRDMPIILNLYVEDRVSHHGPIPIQAFPRMTVGELKSKMFQDFEFPPNVQRWILGRSLITDDDVTLDSKGVDRDGCPIYLYLVSLDECAVSSNAPSSPFYMESHTYENVAASGNCDSGVGVATNGVEEVVLGWRCKICTLINIPTRPGCEACSASRPDDYMVPQKSQVTKNPTHVWEEEDIASTDGEVGDTYVMPGDSSAEDSD